MTAHKASFTLGGNREQVTPFLSLSGEYLIDAKPPKSILFSMCRKSFFHRLLGLWKSLYTRLQMMSTIFENFFQKSPKPSVPVPAKLSPGKPVLLAAVFALEDFVGRRNVQVDDA